MPALQFNWSKAPPGGAAGAPLEPRYDLTTPDGYSARMYRVNSVPPFYQVQVTGPDGAPVTCLYLHVRLDAAQRRVQEVIARHRAPAPSVPRPQTETGGTP